MWSTFSFTVLSLLFVASYITSAAEVPIEKFGFQLLHVENIPKRSLVGLRLGDQLPSLPMPWLSVNFASGSLGDGKNNLVTISVDDEDSVDSVLVKSSYNHSLVLYIDQNADKVHEMEHSEANFPLTENGLFIIGTQSTNDTFGFNTFLEPELNLSEDMKLTLPQKEAIWKSIDRYKLKSYVFGKIAKRSLSNNIGFQPHAVPSIVLSAESIPIVVPTKEDLAMEVLFTHGLDAFTVNAEFPMEPPVAAKSIIQNLTVSSGIGNASLLINQGQGDHLLVKHAGTAWAVVLRADEDADEIREVYPSSILKASNYERFQLAANPDGTSVPIQNNGMFVIFVQMNANEDIPIPTADIQGMLSLSLYADDPLGLQVFTDFLVKKIIGNAAAAVVIGRFISSPRAAASAVPDNVAFGNIQTWKRFAVSMPDYQKTTDHLRFISYSGTGGASVQVVKKDGQIKLIYHQEGLANVLVYRPKVGLVFPDPAIFSMTRQYASWEILEALTIDLCLET